jgi:hypothetical protein
MKLKIELPGTCPHCGGNVVVTAWECPQCGTHTQGHFQPCHFCRLDSEDNRLLFSFLMARGNLKEMEKDLGLSYPTLRGRLETLLSKLGIGDRPTTDTTPPAAPPDPNQGKKIGSALEGLSAGTLSVDEALKRIRAAKSGSATAANDTAEEDTNGSFDQNEE